jgi:hypothetical protein
MADNTTTYKAEVDIDVKSNLPKSIADLKALKKQLKETAAGSEEFKKIYNQIDDLEDKIKGAKGASADWIDTLESAGGPLGALGAGINKVKVATQSFGAAFKAIGIGLLVSLIAGLTAAFASSDDQVKKFQPLLIGLEKIMNGILSAVQPLIDGFIELATAALPIVETGFKKVYAAVTTVFQSLGKLGSAVVKLIKGDFSGAWEDAKASVNDFGKNYDAAKDRFIEGTKKVTKTEKENLKDRKDAADKALQEKLKRLEAEGKMDEAKLAKEKAIAGQTAFNEEQKLAVEEQFAKRSYDLQIDLLNKKQALYKKDSVEWKDLQAQKETAEADYITKTTGFAEQRKTIVENNTKAIVDFEVELARRLQELADEEKTKKLEKEAIAREDSFNLINADFNLKKANNEATYQDEIDTFDKGRELQRADMVARKASATALLAFDKETAAARIEIEKAQQQAKLGVISAALGQISQAVGENTVAGKAFAIAQATIDTYAGATKAMATYPPPFGQIAAGTVILAGLLNVKKIISTQLPKPPGTNLSSSGGGGSAPSISAPTVPTIQAPQLTGTTGGNNPTTQIAETLAGATNKPIKAYVVSGDVSSQQALDRRTSAAATFGG